MDEVLGTNGCEVNLRLSVPKNNQVKGIHLASNYRVI
jgi:hypothetical protein